MKILPFTVFLLVVNKNEAQTSPTSFSKVSEDKNLQKHFMKGDIFTLQIEQIRTTSEATLAALSGNNLNVVVANAPWEVQDGNSQENFRIDSLKSGKNNDEENKGTDNQIKASKRAYIKNDKTVASDVQKLVLENCYETNIRNYNMKNIETTNSVSESDTQNKRDIPQNDYDDWFSEDILYNHRKQQKPDLTNTKKSTILPKTDSIEAVVVAYKPETDIISDTDVKETHKEDWLDKKENIKIRFGELPQRDTYLISSLKLQGFYPFGFMSRFFALIHPFDFPIGLIKEFIWGQLNFPYSFLHSIKVESAFLVFIVVFACMSLIIPAYLIVVCILAFLTKVQDYDGESGALYIDPEDTKRKVKILVIVTVIFLLISCLLICGMELSNEQASNAASETRQAFKYGCADIATWLASASRELHHSLVPPVDMVLHAYRSDLRNVDKLLGEPIIREILSESGIELVLGSLNDITTETEDMTSKISSLRDMCSQAGSLASVTSDRLKDLTRQLDNLKRHCNGKDMKLCDVINTNSLELRMRFDSILHEQHLLDLRSLGVENLTHYILNTKQKLRNLPETISSQTSSVRKAILMDMETRRETIHRSSRILNDIVRYLTATLNFASRKFDQNIIKFQDYDFWRWVSMMGTTVILGTVMIFIFLALLCGITNGKTHAIRTLKFSTLLMCISSLIMWIGISVIFLVSGHAEVFVCHSLWDSPQYKMLTNLFDRPSPLFTNNQGLFDVIFKDLENVTVDVSLRNVLRDCEHDYPAYEVFHLNKVLDVDKETSYFDWNDLQTDLGRMEKSVHVEYLKTVSVDLSRILSEIQIVSNINMSGYRMEYNKAVVGKDLITLADQLENIAAQATDLTTAGRLESLATRTKRLHATNIIPLEQFRADVLFKLTELELQINPYRKKLNVSLSHLYTSQFYINNQGSLIAQKNVAAYINRLISHVADWRTHVLSTAATKAARCQPLFAIFDAARTLICSNYVASLHGWWLCGAMLAMTWCVMAPLCVKLSGALDKKKRAYETMHLCQMSSGNQGTPTTAPCDSSHWNTPGPPPPPRSDSW